MEIKYQSAVLFVREMHRSRSFYEGLLGQLVVMDHGPNVAFANGLALWQADRASEIVYGSREHEGSPLGRRNLELYFETDSLDAAWDRLQVANVPVVHSIREQPWGQRVFRVHDPDGHVVEIGEPMQAVITRLLQQGMTSNAVAERTSMPLDIVRQVIEESTE